MAKAGLLTNKEIGKSGWNLVRLKDSGKGAPQEEEGKIGYINQNGEYIWKPKK